MMTCKILWVMWAERKIFFIAIGKLDVFWCERYWDLNVLLVNYLRLGGTVDAGDGRIGKEYGY